MNKNNRKFLLPFAALVSIFTTGQASANVSNEPSEANPALTEASNNIASDKLIVGDHDQMSFVLKRSAEGTLMAWHESHASHASHRSHYSGS